MPNDARQYARAPLCRMDYSTGKLSVILIAAVLAQLFVP
jgi:hypothetical protein